MARKDLELRLGIRMKVHGTAYRTKGALA